MNPTNRIVQSLKLSLIIAATGCGGSSESTESYSTTQQGLSAPYTASISSGTLRVSAKSGTTQLALRLQAGMPDVMEVDVRDDGTAEFSFDRNLFDRILVEGGSGDDTIRMDESNGAFTDTEITTIDGGRGNDTIRGGYAAETIMGGPGNDTITPGRGDDVVFMGDGDDTVVWNPGDGSDVLEGQSGTDAMRFYGANVGENIEVAANGSRLRFSRDIGLVTMDLNGVERVEFAARGGADNVAVKDLNGTGVTDVLVDLAATPGAADADVSMDSIVLGTAAAETFDISADATQVVAMGLGARVRVKGFEPDDRIVVDGAGQDVVNVNGADTADTMNVGMSSMAGYVRVTAAGFSASVDVIAAKTLAVNGLGGADTMTGTAGVSSLGFPIVIDGGKDNDMIIGGGVDALLGGPGDDTFVWNPGSGSDVIDGQAGQDLLLFRGANIGENISLSANGSRLRLSRDIATITLDVNDVERVTIDALGGADNFVVDDLAGTTVKLVSLDLAGTIDGTLGDVATDQITVNATTGADKLSVFADAQAVVVDGLAAQVRITNAEPALDRLIVDGLGGGDTIRLGTGLEALMSVSVNP